METPVDTFKPREGVLFTEDYIVGDTMFPKGKIGWVRSTEYKMDGASLKEMVWVDMDGRSNRIPVRVLKNAKD